MPADEPTQPPPSRHVPVVDDSPMVAAAHARTLRVRGHRVEVRTSYVEGLDLVEQGVCFDVAVLDVDLEIPSAGFDLGRRLLSRRQVKRLVFCTGTDDPFKAVMALRLGKYVPKGTLATMDELIEAVESELEPQP
jgi:CheY-like chemotaxis protein